MSINRGKLRILGIFYTNSKANPVIIHEALRTADHAANYTKLRGKHHIDIVTSSWKPLAREGHAHISKLQVGGHLNILHQLLHIMYNWEHKDYSHVAFLEHDVLYAPNYFDKVVY